MPPLFRRLTSVLCFIPVLACRAQSPSATSRPSLIESWSAEYSFSGASDITRGGLLGEVSVSHAEGGVSGRAFLSETAGFLYGAAFRVNELHADPGVPLPDRLVELTARLGVAKQFSPRWSVSVSVRPGIYGDFEDVSSGSFNAPALAMATYAGSADLVWLFGVSANAFSEHVVMPVAGVRWKFAPGWTFNLGFPRARVAWDATAQLSLRAGLGIQGGTYRVTGNLGVPAPGIARLANTYLQYREIRVGAGADWKLTERVSLALEAGVMTDRRFEYFDRNYTLNGEASPYVTFGIGGHF
jgi:hypothetical protein